jgi:outer membrane biosynthesis protein TonB
MLAEVFRENDVVHNESYVSVDVGGAAVDRERLEDNRRDRSKQAILLIEVKLDGDGDVADARVVSGPVELRQAALNSVRGWHFDDNNESTRQIIITYHPEPPESTKPSRPEEQSAQSATGSPVYPHLLSADEPVYPPRTRAAQIAGITQVKVTVRDGKVVETVKSGPPIPFLYFAMIQNIRSWKFDPSVNASFVTRFTYQIDKRLAQDTKIEAQLPRQATITVR